MGLFYNYILVFCLLVCVIIGISNKPPQHLKAFLLLMLLTTATEIGNYNHIIPDIHHSNHWSYNVTTILEFYFFAYFFSKILSKRTGKAVAFFVLLYSFCLVASFLTFQSFYRFHVLTYGLGELFVTLFCLFYYRELYMAEKPKPLHQIPEFWIVTGLLIFATGQLPYMLLLEYLNKHYAITSMILRDYVLILLNIIMYFMISIGLLWSLKTRRY